MRGRRGTADGLVVIVSGYDVTRCVNVNLVSHSRAVSQEQYGALSAQKLGVLCRHSQHNYSQKNSHRHRDI